MRIYGSIQTKFWTHADVRQLSDQAKLLATYLLTSSHTNMLGCFRIPIGYIAEDLNWSFEVVAKARDELAKINFLLYDEASSWMIINSFMKYHPIENPNQGKSVAKLFDELPKNLNFLQHLMNELLQKQKHLSEEFIDVLETLAKPFRNQEKEQEQKQYQEKEQELMSGKPDLSHSKDFDFEKSKAQAKQERELLKSQALETLNFLNEKTGRGYRINDTNLNPIIGRLKTGVPVGKCFQVIAKKYRERKVDPKMNTYLRPVTLFNKDKFESYLGEVSIRQTNENK